MSRRSSLRRFGPIVPASLLAAVALTLPFALATPVPPPAKPTWVASVISTAGTYGDNLTVDVIGPANGTFYVALSEPPVNSTPPVAIYYYHLPNGGVSGTNATPAESENASVPLTGVLMGALGIRVYDNATGTILYATVSVVPPTGQQVNYLVGTLTELWVLYNASVRNEVRLQGGIDQAKTDERNAEELLVGGTLANVAFALFVKTERRGWRGWVRKLKGAGHWVKYGKRATISGSSSLPPAEYKPDPSKCYLGVAFARGCDLCQIPASRGWYVAHIEGARFVDGKATLDHGVPKAVLGVHYRKDSDLEAWLKIQNPTALPDRSLFRESLKMMEKGEA